MSTCPRSPTPERRRRPTAPAAISAAVIGAAGLAAFVLGRVLDPGPADGELLTTQDLPADVRAELDTVWSRFGSVFAERSSCIGDVTVVLVRSVDGGDARYVASEGLIEVRIPTTPARFRESVAHELAHHVDRTCREFAGLRDELHRRLGGPERPWATGDVWEEIPAERYAEAVVELVNEERVRHADEVRVDDATVELIARWGRGETIGS